MDSTIIRSLAAAALCMAVPVAAQTARPTLDYATAAKIRDTCIAWAEARDLKLAIVVMEPRGMAVTLAHMDGVSTAGGEIARWKAVSAAKFGRTTADTAAMNPPAGMPSVAALQGGVPIYLDDHLLGGVGVSGARPADDAACAVAGIEAAGLRTDRPARSSQ